ncbi:RNA polymerase subunit sigma-70 [Putridiphycobacter roseus]|uniref:RNA polymerase subunit sigma-70 n=1 Tax=Putridiphycobacter roseus TaxID=2219161 RepID=A0A2W1N358_9FLAO|nr:sigma-70 family RNA polymerase sigma factor [Putridiphycobacter roseus]PZE18757.1 RNA polymerase subunit sigma-70 [Putridiphycobacter roseus]
MEKLSDKALIKKFLEEKDVSGFEMLYDRYVDKVYGRCLRFTHNESESKDFTQEIFIKVLGKLSSIKDGEYFSTWLYTLTYRFCIDKYRANKKNIFEDEWLTEIEDVAAEHDFSALQVSILEQGLTRLSSGERSLLFMKYNDELEVGQIAILLEMGESAVKMRLKRTRDKLKAICEVLIKE